MTTKQHLKCVELQKSENDSKGGDILKQATASLREDMSATKLIVSGISRAFDDNER